MPRAPALHGSGPAPAPGGPRPYLAPAPAALPVTAPGTAWALAGFALGLLACFAAAGAVDARTFQGDNVWLKPAKFALSFVVLFATLALVLERLSEPVRNGRALRLTLAAMTVAFWAEMAYIGGRAGRAEASHFNEATPLAALMYGLMGLGAVTLVIGIGIVGWLAGRDRRSSLGPGLRQGVFLGFGLSMVATLITAGVLSANGGHFVGTPAPGAAGIPLLGWSGEVGDLRPAHFLALHAMQVLPLLGLWLDRLGQAPTRWLAAATAAYALLTAAVFLQALAGQPLVRM